MSAAVTIARMRPGFEVVDDRTSEVIVTREDGMDADNAVIVLEAKGRRARVRSAGDVGAVPLRNVVISEEAGALLGSLMAEGRSARHVLEQALFSYWANRREDDAHTALVASRVRARTRARGRRREVGR